MCTCVKPDFFSSIVVTLNYGETRERGEGGRERELEREREREL